MEEVTEIKKLLKENKLVFGTDLTMKGIRNKSLDKIFVANNCPLDIKDDIRHYAEISEIEVVDLKLSNSELGDICKKPFHVSVISVPKQ